MTNQFMGHAMRSVENRFELTSYFGQPKALALNTAITLIIENDYVDSRRISFSINDVHRFYLELAMERTEFIRIES